MSNSLKTGLDILAENDFQCLKGCRIGLVANQSSITSDFRYSFDLLVKSKKVNLAAIFSPEHGRFGSEQDMVPVKDQRFDPGKNRPERQKKPAGKKKSADTPVPVISLYGKTGRSLIPDKKAMESLDALVFDVQDVGARYYTFIYTMSFCMEACAKHGKTMFILDRPNPINGINLEGPVLKKSFSSFVGRFPIPVRHGMTVGELAFLFNVEFGIGCELRIIKMKGWKRRMWFDETGLPWIAPSPNMPTLDTATLYPGTCLLEGTNLSEGRGTTKPFEYIGAPWIDPERFTKALKEEKLPGVVFRPIRFQPKFQKWKDEACGGVHIAVTDRRCFKPFLTGVAILSAALKLYPGQFQWRQEPYEFVDDRLAIDLLAGSDRLRRQLESGTSLKRIESSWQKELKSFAATRKKYLLYPY
ncbi:MAG: DUF1343 domain-containing protein [Acidobacteriota bacterium]